MSRLVWDQVSERYYETGVKNGVMYKQNQAGSYPEGIAWNGLISVSESPSGGDTTALYADDTKYLNLVSTEEFGATVEAYTYPDEFEECDGTAEVTVGARIGQQNRTPFGMVYKTTLGNDTEGNAYGYKLHLIYGALAAPSEKTYQTINDSPEAITFSWDVTTTPVQVTGLKPTASMTVNSTKVDADKLAALELVLFGDTGINARLPLPDEVKTILESTPSAIEVSSVVPADDATNVAVDSDVVITFNNAIVSESITVVSSTGTVVAGAKTWDATGKILTFNPTVNLSNATTYIVTIHGVVDMYSQLLATEASNFSTIA